MILCIFFQSQFRVRVKLHEKSESGEKIWKKKKFRAQIGLFMVLTFMLSSTKTHMSTWKIFPKSPKWFILIKNSLILLKNTFDPMSNYFFGKKIDFWLKYHFFDFFQKRAFSTFLIFFEIWNTAHIFYLGYRVNLTHIFTPLV